MGPHLVRNWEQAPVGWGQLQKDQYGRDPPRRSEAGPSL